MAKCKSGDCAAISNECTNGCIERLSLTKNQQKYLDRIQSSNSGHDRDLMMKGRFSKTKE